MKPSAREQPFAPQLWRALPPEALDHPFATFEVLDAWQRVFGVAAASVVVVARDGKTRALLPLRRTDARGAAATFLGDRDVIDYMGPVSVSGAGAEAAAALVDWLEAAAVALFESGHLRSDTGFAQALASEAQRRGWDAELAEDDVAAVVDLPPTWDEYLVALGKRRRHELRRKLRRFDSRYPEARIRRSTSETLENDLTRFVELHLRSSTAKREFFTRPHMEAFFRRLAAAAAEHGMLRLDLLEVDGRVAAANFGFELDGTFFLYNSAYDADVAAVAPGIKLTAALIRQSIERGLSTFDLLCGTEAYKSDLGARERPLLRVRVRAEPSGPGA